MGFKISWIAFEGMDKADVLSRMAMSDTGKPDEAYEASFSLAQLPTGWSVLFANDFEYASDRRMAPLSAGGRLIALQVHEGVMCARAVEFRNGQLIWWVGHDSEEGIEHLDAEGDLPAAFAVVRARLFAEQAENGGTEADVDYIFDVPVELAAELTGYRHDQAMFDWGEPLFTAVEAASRPASKGWLERLFGGRA